MADFLPTPDLHRRRVLIAAAGGGLLAATAWPLLRVARAAATHTVVMQATSYAPAMLSIARGDTVVWVNKDPFPHTVTAVGHFDSGSIGVDASWTFVADSAGSFDYTCVFHPNMKGRLIVS